MSYPKLKKETYNCSGGINQKISQYLAQEGEFLNLQNLDLLTLGALSRVPGFTNYSQVSGLKPAQIRGLAAYNTPLFSSATYVFSSTYALLAANNLYLYHCSGTTFVTMGIGLNQSVLSSTNRWAFADGGSGVFGCNGWNAFSYFGSTVGWAFAISKPTFGQSAVVGATAVGAGTGGISGTAVMYYSIVREDGLYGPALAHTQTVAGQTCWLFDVPTAPQAYQLNSAVGFSGIRAWISLNGGVALGYTGLFSFGTLGSTGTPLGATIALNFTASGWNITTPQPRDYQGSFYWGLGATQGSDNSTVAFPRVPAVMESFANRLFSTGFALQPNRVVYSDPGAPEVADYENFFDVGTAAPNTAMSEYLSQLVIWKFGETWALSGADPDSFVLTQVNPVYGCISKSAVCVWDQHLWFLDVSGICEFNGANVQVVSDKVEPIFRDMDIAGARVSATMIYVKSRKEVWCLVPTVSEGNVLVVYDTESNGWTVRRSSTITNAYTLAALRLGDSTERVFCYGNGSTGLLTFGASFWSDSGVGSTWVMKSRFVEGDMGHSVTKQWRRLYVDATVPDGSTYPVTANFYTDMGSSIVYSTTMMLSGFQTRIDFGIPAKSIAFELIGSGASFIRLSGFTFEYRFQRAT